MSSINFLDNKKHDNQKPKGNKKEKLAWFSPKKEVKGPKGFAFPFLPFRKKEPTGENSVSIIDKNKIKQSREEILNLIKHHENSESLPEEKNKNFLATLGKKLKKQLGRQEVLIDYQRVFNQEKENRDQIGKIFNVKPAAAPPPVIRPEEKLAEVKETKAKEPGLIHKNEIRQRVIETNLIQGELVTFFDWHSKIIVSAGAILMPIFVIGAVYYGLVFYQKSSQAKNLAQAQKFAELEQNIAKEEAGIKEISGFEAQLKTVSKIFGQHLYWTNFFKFLENNTIKNVYFVNFNGDTSGNYIMDALATNYSDIARQVDTFRNDKKITAVEAGGGEMVKGDNTSQSLVKFVLNFTVLKNIFIE